MAKNKKPTVAIDELLTAARTTPAKEDKRSAFGVLAGLTTLVVLAVVGGLVATSLALPSTLVAAGTTQNAISWWDKLPSTLGSVKLPERTVLLDRNGKRLAQLYTENRVSVPLASISPNVSNALIATEDSRFYEHGGLDAKGLGRAVVNNVLGDSTQGASTLTQQLVENVRAYQATTDEERLAARAQNGTQKLQELRYATGIENSSTKDEILEAYLNIVYFGNGAYGIEAAAERYFSTQAKNLTPPQAATLIGMLKNPTGYDPVRAPEASRLRRDVVMKRMVVEKYITEADYQTFIATPTPLKLSTPERGCGNSTYPFYCQLVVSNLLKDPAFGKTPEARQAFVNAGGLTITTALDPKTMDQAQAAVDAALGRNNRVAAGVAMVQPGTGQVLAISQNRSWGTPKKKKFNKTQMVYADTPSFQVGSTFKPITAAAALEEGFSASTRLNAPNGVKFKGLDSPAGGFKNDTRRGYGAIDLPTALQYSVNTYFVGLTQKTGVKDVAAMARRLGMKSVPSNLTGREGSITLGAYESDPIELASVYATLAGRGVACDPVTILSAKRTATGGAVKVPSGNCRQEISPAVADTVSASLRAPFKAGGTAAKLGIGRKAAGKTGTTDDAAATWFSGYTPQVATSVWIGDPRGGAAHPLVGVNAYGNYYRDVFGGTIAGPIWQDVMRDFHKGQPEKWYPKPGGVTAAMSSRIVPEVKGMGVDAAITLLLKSGFKVKVAEATVKAPNVSTADYVAGQSPAAGGKAAYGDTITLKLTEGSDTKIQIPATYDELVEREAQAATAKDKP